MITALEKVGILVEALPYIKKFHGYTVVIKYGGHAMQSEELKRAVLEDVVLMKLVGMNPVLVHGGGPEITDLLKRLGKESTFVNGLRVTDAETMQVVEMVLGKVNKEIVACLQLLGAPAAGICGKDGGLLEALPQQARVRGEDGREATVDLGLVGEVRRVNPGILHTLIDHGYLPVVSPVGMGPEGQGYNINADLVASSLAGALKAAKLVLLTDVEGIFTRPSDPASLLSSLSKGEAESLIREGIIAGGMIPKVQCCLEALENGVPRAHIVDGRLPHSLLLEIFTDHGIGTMVVKERVQEADSDQN